MLVLHWLGECPEVKVAKVVTLKVLDDLLSEITVPLVAIVDASTGIMRRHDCTSMRTATVVFCTQFAHPAHVSPHVYLEDVLRLCC
jgi:hypothetical protein